MLASAASSCLSSAGGTNDVTPVRKFAKTTVKYACEKKKIYKDQIEIKTKQKKKMQHQNELQSKWC